MVDLQGIGGNGIQPLSNRSGETRNVPPKAGQSHLPAPHGTDEVLVGTPCREPQVRSEVLAPEVLSQAVSTPANAVPQEIRTNSASSRQLFASEGYFLSGTAGVPAQDKEFPGDDLAINSPFSVDKEQGFISATGQPINYKFIFQE